MASCADSVSGLVVIIDQLNVNECIAFNRAMRYRYDQGYIATLSAYDDKTIFPECAGKFARPTPANIVKGIRWLLGQAKPGQQVLVAVLGNVAPALGAQIQAELSQAKLAKAKDIRLVLVSTSPTTFGNVAASVNVCGPAAALALFDGTEVVPSKLATKAIVKTADGVDRNRPILLPKPKPWDN